VKDSQQVSEYIEDGIAQICVRTLMYGGTAEGVDLVLHYHCELWAFIHERRDAYQQICFDVHIKEGCGSASFATHYRRTRPDAPDEETAGYVVEQWKVICRLLGMDIDEREARHREELRSHGVII
jgi:hypothetical protein